MNQQGLGSLVPIVHGTIVLPQGDPKERIIGLTLDIESEDPHYVPVMWLSDQRGAFWCYELVGDLMIPPCFQRTEISDPTLDQETLADAIRQVILPDNPRGEK